MSTSVTFNGSSYTIPAIADASWGTNVSNYMIAIASGTLQKTGGSFTLSAADVDFGATYGLKAVYFKSKTANIAAAGVVQLAKTDVMSWRNNANGADLALGINGSDALIFNSIAIADASSSMTFTNKLFSDSTCKFANVSDATKLLKFSLGGATTGKTMTFVSSHTNDRSITFPDASDTLVGLATTDTMSNKTFVAPVLGAATATSINRMAITAPASASTLAVADAKVFTVSNTLTLAGTDGNSFTFPSGSSTLMTLASADTITGVKTFGDAKFVLSGASSGAMTVKAPAAASTFVATFFAATDTVVGLTFQQTMTNKLLSDSTIKFANVSDATKLLLFSLGGATTAKTMTFISSHTNDRSITFPDATDTLVGKATTDALTNKDYQGGTASDSLRLTIPKNTATNLTALTRKQATIFYDTTNNVCKYDDGTNLSTFASNATATASTTGIVTSFAPLVASRYKEINDAAYTVLDGDGYDLIYSTTTMTAARTVTLPTLADNLGREIVCKKLDTSTKQILLDGEGAETIDGFADWPLVIQGDSVTVRAETAGWAVIAKSSVTKWISFTPTTAWTTNTTATGFYRRSGQNLEVQVRLAFTGAPDNTGFTHTLPLSATIDTAAMFNDIWQPLGQAITNDSSSQYYYLWVFYGSSTTVTLLASNIASTFAGAASYSRTSPYTIGNGDYVQFTYTVPISGWRA